jgi:hypothetical protein
MPQTNCEYDDDQDVTQPKEIKAFEQDKRYKTKENPKNTLAQDKNAKEITNNTALDEYISDNEEYSQASRFPLPKNKSKVNFENTMSKSRIVVIPKDSACDSSKPICSQSNPVSSQSKSVGSQSESVSSQSKSVSSQSKSSSRSKSAEPSLSLNRKTSMYLEPEVSSTDSDNYETDKDVIPIKRKGKKFQDNSETCELLPLKKLYDLGGKGIFPERIFTIGQFLSFHFKSTHDKFKNIQIQISQARRFTRNLQ